MDNKKIGRQLNMDELEKVAGGGIGKKTAACLHRWRG